MASETVIDALIVRLGLDPTSYKKGVADATRAQKALKDNTKKSGNEITDSLKAVTRQVAAMVLGFESLKGAISFLAGINTADAALGRLAANTGTNVHELNRWGLAVELAGGDAKEAQGDVSNLASSITALKATGEVSPLLLLMQRLGVAIFDAEGKTRNLFDILNDAGGKLRQFNKADAFQLAKGAGLSAGTLNLLLLEDKERQKRFADAERQNNLDEAAAERAAATQRQWRELTQSVRAFGRELLETVTPAAVAFFNALKPAAESLRGIIEGLNNARVGEALATAINGVVSALAFMVDKLPAAQAAMASFFEYIGPKIEFVAGKIAGLVDALNKVGSFVGKTVADVQDYFTTPAEQRPALPGTERSPSALARAAQQQRLAAYQARQSAQAPGGTTTVQIDNIEVHTAATDAEGIARDLPAALARKGVVAQADTGMN